jgi:hypothetical protein
MPHYRVYVLDESRQLTAAVNFDCAEDDEAIEHADGLADRHEVELWRLVAQVEIDEPAGPRTERSPWRAFLGQRPL